MKSLSGVSTRIIIVCAILSFLFFVIDSLLPLGVAGGIPYVVVVLLSLWTSNPLFTIVTSLFCTMLIVAGYYTSPAGGVFWMVLLNRSLAITAIWVLSAIGIVCNNAKKALARSSSLTEKTFDMLLDSILVVEAGNLKIKDCNKATEKMFGYKKEEIIEQSVQFLQGSDSTHDVFNQVDHTEPADETCSDHRLERLMRHKDGTLFFTEQSVIPLEYKEGECSEWIYIIHDISDQKKNEDQIKRSLAEKGTLVRELHHRVKNNLQLISSMLSLQSKAINDKKIHRLFNESINRIRVMSLVHKKLYQSDKEDVTTIDVKDYIETLCTGLANSYNVSQSDIKLKIDSDPGTIDTERAILCGLILNELVSNAMKYAFSDGKKGEIVVKLNMQGSLYTLSVSDNGVGLSEDINIRDAKTLGLQLVSDLTDQLEGTIALDSRNGTSFMITFPRP